MKTAFFLPLICLLALPLVHLVRLEIAPYPVDCLGAFPKSCLQVRESSMAPFVSLNGQFIEFMFQEGVRSFIVADKSLSSDLTHAGLLKRHLCAQEGCRELQRLNATTSLPVKMGLVELPIVLPVKKLKPRDLS